MVASEDVIRWQHHDLIIFRSRLLGDTQAYAVQIHMATVLTLVSQTADKGGHNLLNISHWNTSLSTLMEKC